MQTYHGHTGYKFPNDSSLCVRCARANYEDDVLAGSAPMWNGEYVEPIFVSSERVFKPECLLCGNLIDCTPTGTVEEIDRVAETVNTEILHIQYQLKSLKLESEGKIACESYVKEKTDTIRRSLGYIERYMEKKYNGR